MILRKSFKSSYCILLHIFPVVIVFSVVIVFPVVIVLVVIGSYCCYINRSQREVLLLLKSLADNRKVSIQLTNIIV
jgi:hypothetical protein